MSEPIIVPVTGGTYTCPEHPEMGPVAVGYTGGTVPAQVAVTHDEEGLHHAVAVEDEAVESTDDPTGGGETDDGAAAETSQADGSQQKSDDGAAAETSQADGSQQKSDGGDGANQSA